MVVRLLLTEKGTKGGPGEKGPQGMKGIPGRPGPAIFVDSGEEILTIKGEKVRLALLRIQRHVDSQLQNQTFRTRETTEPDISFKMQKFLCCCES